MTHTRNGTGPRPTVIEFIGGPYDGHKEPCLTQTARLPADVVWCVCDDAFRMLEGEESQPGGSITSVAVYRLAVTHGAPLYRFAGAISANELTDTIRGIELRSHVSRS